MALRKKHAQTPESCPPCRELPEGGSRSGSNGLLSYFARMFIVSVLGLVIPYQATLPSSCAPWQALVSNPFACTETPAILDLHSCGERGSNSGLGPGFSCLVDLHSKIVLLTRGHNASG